MCHGLLPLEWQVMLGQDRLLSANKKYGESILTILTLDGVGVENLPCFGVPEGAYVIIWAKATSCFGGGEPEVVCPPVSSSLRFVW